MQTLLMHNLRIGFEANTSLCLKLVDSIAADDAYSMPAEGVNHPAWILRHLSTYHPVILKLLRGENPDDPGDAPFGRKSEPIADPSVYGSWTDIKAAYTLGVDEICETVTSLASVEQSTLLRTMPVERWRTRFPTAGSILAYLMVHHEGFHVGQLSAWRRFRGMPRV